MTGQKLRYTSCGLDNVYLLNGYSVVRTRRGTITRIEDPQGLHSAIGACLVRQKRGLTGRELRFLRQELGLSQPALATLLGESAQSVARREKSRKGLRRLSAQERMLRFMFEQRLGKSQKMEEFLRALADLDEVTRTSVEFRRSKNPAAWQSAEAVAA